MTASPLLAFPYVAHCHVYFMKQNLKSTITQITVAVFLFWVVANDDKFEKYVKYNLEF